MPGAAARIQPEGRSPGPPSEEEAAWQGEAARVRAGRGGTRIGGIDMTALTYAGIGARATPSSVLADMAVIAGWLARTGWHLHTGGAHVADTDCRGRAGRPENPVSAVAGI